MHGIVRSSDIYTLSMQQKFVLNYSAGSKTCNQREEHKVVATGKHHNYVYPKCLLNYVYHERGQNMYIRFR